MVPKEEKFAIEEDRGVICPPTIRLISSNTSCDITTGDIMTTNRTNQNIDKKAKKDVQTTTHFYILLDRSGSMESMKSDVIGGYNAFITEQQTVKGKAKVTLVQFDSQEPQEVLADAKNIGDITPLTGEMFSPRGGTPLLDASAQLIERVLGRQNLRKITGKNHEEIVFITITDGEENQSTKTSLKDITKLIKQGKEDGWSFVFLGAGIDAYAEATRLGYDAGSVQAWEPTGESAKTMWGSVSRASKSLREDVYNQISMDKKAFFRGVKEAEQQGDL